MRFVFLACVAGCLLAGCVDHQSVAVQAASDALSCEPQNVDAYPMDDGQWDARGCGSRVTLQCVDDPDNDNAYTCTPVGNTTSTLYRLGE